MGTTILVCCQPLLSHRIPSKRKASDDKKKRTGVPSTMYGVAFVFCVVVVPVVMTILAHYHAARIIHDLKEIARYLIWELCTLDHRPTSMAEQMLVIEKKRAEIFALRQDCSALQKAVRRVTSKVDVLNTERCKSEAIERTLKDRVERSNQKRERILCELRACVAQQTQHAGTRESSEQTPPNTPLQHHPRPMSPYNSRGGSDGSEEREVRHVQEARLVRDSISPTVRQVHTSLLRNNLNFQKSRDGRMKRRPLSKLLDLITRKSPCAARPSRQKKRSRMRGVLFWKKNKART